MSDAPTKDSVIQFIWISEEAEKELVKLRQEQQALTGKIVAERERIWRHNDRILHPARYAIAGAWRDKFMTEREDRMRNLKVLSETPGELSFRREVHIAFESVNSRLGKIDVRLARIEERMLSRVAVTEMIKAEMKALIDDVATLKNIVWGSLGTFFGAIIVAAVGIAVVKVLK